ncbi:MAG: cell division protein FtsZ [Candidatus Magasanikbacteria bacterium]|nr:cell division protein FtsZ [Candidatus Magasanikbacteria bacterium]
MPQVKPDIETFAKIKVVGVGGSGGSAVNRMMAARIRGVDFVVMNTDVQDLHHNLAPHKLHIGKSVTRGLGAGMDPELGRRAAEESQNEIREILKDADMVFVTCGLGGGTGSGASPVVAEVARELGALTVAVVTKPFAFEGQKRREIADKAWENLVKHVDTIITIPNDRINQVIDKKTSMLDAFRIADDVLRQGVQGISELITMHGVINVDFADIKTIMKDTGSALMGIGIGSGENRAVDAAKSAISSPLLELSIDGARGILFTVTGGQDLAMSEVEDAAKIITSSAAEDAKVIFGAIIDETMNDSVKITVIATGFDDRRPVSEEETLTRYSPFGTVSLASKFKQRGEETEDKKFFNDLTSTKKSGARSSTQAEPTVMREQKNDVLAQNQQNAAPAGNANITDDDLEIPAFIRRKMGV